MSNRALVVARAVVTVALLVSMTSIPLAGQTSARSGGARAGKWTAPRTPWGDPDLQGFWPSTEMVSVPLERPSRFGERLLLTDEELAKRAEQDLAMRRTFERDGAGGGTGTPGHWLEFGTPQRQASLLVDPPNGKMPAMTAEGQKRLAAAPRGTFGTRPLEGPEDFSMYERCITRGVLGSTMPVLYNNGYQIVQSPGYVAIRYEMIPETRMIPLDGRPHAGNAIHQYLGDARGRWEGDTLVVETTNFTDRTGVGINGGGVHSDAMRLVERFTRVDPNTIQYQATVDDPRTWTAPWTVAFPLKQDPRYGMFEYACHEGNLGLRNSLSASRTAERAAK